MTIFTSPRPLQWGQLDLPLLGLDRDWHSDPQHVPGADW